MKKLKEEQEKRKLMLCLDVNLSIRLQYVAFRLIPLLLPSTSSMEFLRKMRVFAMNSPPLQGQIHPSFKAKTADENT